jgi:hypothetical protein
MADTDPMDGGSHATFNLPPEHVEFLRATFADVREGLLGDLKHPEQLRDAKRVRLEADAYTRLLALLDGEPVAVDGDMRLCLDELARSVDAINEYERVVFEHAVLWGIIGELEKATGRRR